MSDTSSTDVAPVSAVSSHVGDTVSASVNNEVWVPTSSVKLVLNHLYVVKLRIASVPLAFKSARVFATGFTLMLSVQAIVISSCSTATLPWAHLTERLIVSDVSSKSTEFLIRQSFDNWDKCGHIIGPSKPSTMSSIKVH